MKTVFDASTREELINRIRLLDENGAAQWGKMTVYQMLKHCTLWEEWISSEVKHRQIFMGRIFGKMVLRNMLKDEKPLKRNTPTDPALLVTSTQGNVDAEKAKWITMIGRYAHFTNPEFVHSFFGKMTEEQIGILAYKHADHHLRQFKR
jgi:hypothetical protein